ncbi:uncharacterized protein LOC127700541 isoform X1 [Mytilus californianus]|uniref:uncharacterized protein LOC127700541 isoform X1 n=1 Tax=Mytilus californianus TaxID=6549 RepID=UPI00224866C0|nr:uncharacterized protein LOC127700541 isoform X1 [Mytilus californianus]
MLERDHQVKLKRPNVFPYARHKWVSDLIAKVQAKRNEAVCKEGRKDGKNKLPFIFGEHTVKNRYPSSKWQTENQIRYKVIDFSRTPRDSPPFLVTTLDDRYHNPHSKQIFHIKRINNKPVCSVNTWKNYPNEMEKKTQNKTIYSSSFEHRTPDVRVLIKNQDKHVLAQGIVPFDQPENTCDVKEEMFLPICDTTRIPSAPNPHRYLLRKKRIPAPHQPMGIFYPESPQPDLPPERPKTQCDKVSISTLCGQEFTRKKYIPQPRGNFEPGAFDGGAPQIQTHRFNDKFLPLVRVKPII